MRQSALLGPCSLQKKARNSDHGPVTLKQRVWAVHMGSREAYHWGDGIYSQTFHPALKQQS